MKDKVLDFIKLIKGPTPEELFGEGFKSQMEEGEYEASTSSFIIEEIFTCGCCGRFALILKYVFPEAKLYEINDPIHVITKIGKKFYDVTGDVTEKYSNKEMRVIDEEYIRGEVLDDNYSFYKRGPII